MTEHEGLGWLIIIGGVIQLSGLFLLGLQLREARRETQRLFTATAGMVHQEAQKILADLERRRG